MKKIFVLLFGLGFLINSCSDGEKAKTEEAQEVVSEKSDIEEDLSLYPVVGDDSHLIWGASHLGGIEPRFGKVFIQGADVAVGGDGTLQAINIVLDMASITVENFENDPKKTNKLTNHLLSMDFFNVEKYPTATFELTSLEDALEGSKFSKIVSGNLTILEAKKNITFNANVEISDDKVSVASEKFVINRHDWGISYNKEGTPGLAADYVISDDVSFQILATFMK